MKKCEHKKTKKTEANCGVYEECLSCGAARVANWLRIEANGNLSRQPFTNWSK